MFHLGIFDWAIGIIIFLSCLLGIFRGAAKEIISLVGWIIIVVLTVKLCPLVAGYIGSVIKIKILAKIIAGVVIFALLYLMVFFFTTRIAEEFSEKIPSVYNKSGGLAIGVLRGYLLCSLIFYGVIKTTNLIEDQSKVGEEKMAKINEKSIFVKQLYAIAPIFELVFKGKASYDIMMEKMDRKNDVADKDSEKKDGKDGLASNLKTAAQNSIREIFTKLTISDVSSNLFQSQPQYQQTIARIYQTLPQEKLIELSADYRKFVEGSGTAEELKTIYNRTIQMYNQSRDNIPVDQQISMGEVNSLSAFLTGANVKDVVSTVMKPPAGLSAPVVKPKKAVTAPKPVIAKKIPPQKDDKAFMNLMNSY